jgi:acyl carrier protein
VASLKNQGGIMSIAAELSSKIASQLLKQPDRQIDPNESLIKSGLIDSFKLVDLSILVEDEYGILLDDFELNADTFDTITELAEIIQSRT